MMKKISLIALALCLVLSLAACNQKPAPDSSSESEVEPVANTNPGTENPDTTGGDSTSPDSVASLTLDEYDGLVITATLPDDGSVAPGAAIPVAVTIQNTSDKTIAYIRGSGSFSTPQGLTGGAEHLQYVIPKDNLGIATMDFRVEELVPDEGIAFTLYFMAIEPSSEFDTYTYDAFNNNQTYIADMSWEDIQAAHTDLVATETGSYTGAVYLHYSLLSEGSQPIMSSDPTGYAQADFTVEIA